MPENPRTSASSLGARLTNVFVSPSEVFDEVKAGPPTPANWIVPLVATMLVGIIFVMVVLSQPAVLQTMKDTQDKKYQEMVAKGKKTQQQVDKIRETADKIMTPGILKSIGILSSIIGNAMGLFLTAGVVWLLGRYAFHAPFGYMQAVEMAGLALMITVLAAIINMLLIVIYGNLSMTASPVLLLGLYDSTKKAHLLLATLNIFTLWYVAVLAVGLAKLSGTSFLKAAIWLFGLWALITIVPILVFK